MRGTSMARASLHMYALRRAVGVLGGVTPLAKRLGISQTKVNLYLADLAPVPETVFLRIVDILTEDELMRLSNEAKGQPPRGNGGEATPNYRNKDENGRRRKV